MENTTQTCRNCGASDFYSKDVSLVGHAGTILPIGMFTRREVHLRVCGTCGLMEWFVTPPTLEKLKQKFTEVP